MGAFGEALKAVREVIVLGERIEAMDQRIERLATDVDGLADLVSALRDRVARIEGFIEGATATRSAPVRKKLPPAS
jgi:hypothetical protein